MDSTSAASEPRGGRFVDGVSARIHEASVQAREDGLHIRWEGGEALWPWREISRRDSPQGEVRLGLRGDDPARLTLREGDWRALAPQRVNEGRVRLGKEALTGLYLTGAAAAVLGVILVGWPILASAISQVAPVSFEAKMGVAAQKQMEVVFKPCPGAAGAEGSAVLTRLAQRMADHSETRFPIRVTIVDASFPNAFALPAGAIYVTSDLLKEADRPDEVAGVLAHEIGHVSERHVVKGFVRALGLGALTDLVIGGGSGAAAPIATAAINVSALRYSRDDEAAADARGLDYMDATGLDPAGLARFFDKMSKLERSKDGKGFPEFLSSHPDSGARAQLARGRANPGASPALSDADWAIVKAACGKAR